MSYVIGDKFIFEIDRIYSSKKHAESRFGIKGFENLVLSKRKLDELLRHKNIKELNEYDAKGWKLTEERIKSIRDDAYQRGLEDAWEAAEKVLAEMDYDDVCGCFGVECGNDNGTFFNRFSPQKAIDRLKEYEEGEKTKKTEFHLGDEVVAWDTNTWVKFIAVGDIGDGTINGFDLKGGSYEYPVSSCRKTGKHYEIKETNNIEADKLPWA